MELARDPDFVSPKKRKCRCGEDVAGSSKRFLKMSESEVANISLLPIRKKYQLGPYCLSGVAK